MKNLLTLFFLTIFSLSAMANGTEVNGICYIFDKENRTASVTYLGDGYYNTTDLHYSDEIIIPDTLVYGDARYVVTSIGKHAFYRCSAMTSVQIPNTVTKIGSQAFCYCTGLSTLTFPESITNVGSYALTGIKSNTVFTCMALTPPAVEYNDIGNTTMTIYVPAEAVGKYKSSLGWKKCTVLPIMLEAEKTSDYSANVTWFPVETADTYQIFVEAYIAYTLVYTDTLYVAADSENGGAMTTAVFRMPADEGGTIIVVTIDPTSGASVDNPFLLTISTEQRELLDCRVKVIAYHDNVVVKQDQVLFSLNDSQGIVNIPYSNFPTGIYDLSGHCYGIDPDQNLPTGVYILRDADKVTKILK